MILSKRLRSIAGFTMIELLVVIAIIGVLAVAVLSAINPIEQINKGRDTRSRSDAGELLSAIERYYSTSEQYPWNSASVAEDPYGDWAAVETVDEEFSSVTALDWLQVLENSNEVKESFASRIYNNYADQAEADTEFVVLKDAESDEVKVCFLPASQQFRNEAIYKCCLDDSDANKCSDAAAENLKGSTENIIAGFTVCGSTDGSEPEDSEFFICLP